MSLPRNYTLSDDYRLLINPAGDVESLRGATVCQENITLPSNEEFVLDRIKGTALEMEVILEPQDAGMVDLNLLRNPDKSEYTTIRFYPRGGDCYSNADWDNRDSLIILDTSFSSTGQSVYIRGSQKCSFMWKEETPLTLRVFVDRSVVEVFVNGQSACLARVYPENPESTGVSLTARGGSATCRSIRSWEMKRIF